MIKKKLDIVFSNPSLWADTDTAKLFYSVVQKNRLYLHLMCLAMVQKRIR